MGQKLRLLKEYERSTSDSDSSILTVDLDRFDSAAVDRFLVLFNDYWKLVNQEDQSIHQVYTLDSSVLSLPEIKATLYMLLQEGVKVKLAYKGSDLVGFLVYHVVYKSVVVIRHLYSIRERSQAAKILVNATLPQVKKLIFQTRKQNPPERVLGMIKGATVLAEDDNLIDWEMNWHG